MTKHIAFAALFALGSTAAVAGQDGQTPNLCKRSRQGRSCSSNSLRLPACRIAACC